MPLWNKVTEDVSNQLVREYLETDKSTEQIAKDYGLSYHTVFRHIHNKLDKGAILACKQRRYRKSKLGANNPMTGKTKERHPNYKGKCMSRNNVIVLKPEWYTGRKTQRHVYESHVVICENLGLTEIPKGYHVHHCDFDRTNNSFDNLVLLTQSAHSRLHWHCLHSFDERGKEKLKGATTISKESTLKWVEAHGGGLWKRSADDIV